MCSPLQKKNRRRASPAAFLNIAYLLLCKKPKQDLLSRSGFLRSL
ncbi:Hypothetical protein Cp106_1634 [Corynebacterium pseudotuberculosis 1/06-A]|nr:Hypothetical protein Cp106_1634 [Corynebacterium pseudotuberculosis 1/06-A]